MELEAEKILKNKDIGYKLIKLNDRAFTVDDVVKYSQGDIAVDEICKTIILIGKKSGKRVAVFLRGSDRLNFSKAKKVFGEDMRIAGKEMVQDVAGVEPGAVCPFILNIPLLVDERVLDLQKINCGSGDHLYGLEIQVRDLNRAVSYTSGSFTK